MTGDSRASRASWRNTWRAVGPCSPCRSSPLGTEFQLRVWELIAQVPYGQTATYGDLARRLGGRENAQEVGAAVGRNPLSILIPCHRVIGSNGKLNGYADGLKRKQKLLDLELGPLISEENPLGGVSATADGPQRRRAVKPAIDLALAVPAEPARGSAAIQTPVGAQQRIRAAAWLRDHTGGAGHQAASWKTRASVNRCPDRITDTPWRTGAHDQPRRDSTGRSRVVKTRPWPCGIRVAVARDWARGRCS